MTAIFETVGWGLASLGRAYGVLSAFLTLGGLLLLALGVLLIAWGIGYDFRGRRDSGIRQ